jgi:hypothetical protein
VRKATRLPCVPPHFFVSAAVHRTSPVPLLRWQSFRKAMERRLMQAGYEVSTYPSAQHLLDCLPSETVPGCILLDVRSRIGRNRAHDQGPSPKGDGENAGPFSGLNWFPLLNGSALCRATDSQPRLSLNIFRRLYCPMRRPKGARAVLDHLCRLQFTRIDGCGRANRSSASQK